MSPAQLIMVGCNHRHTSLAVRERLAFTPEQATDALAAWIATHADRMEGFDALSTAPNHARPK